MKRMAREQFSTGFAVFFATLGSTVGLGSIWKFPYLIGMFGGGAFLLIYLISIVFVGLPIMTGEFYIGRKTRKNAVGAFNHLEKPQWKAIGYIGVLSAYLIMFFYSAVAGWVYYYVFKVMRGDFISVSSESVQVQFIKTVTGFYIPVFWQGAVIFVVSLILILGVRKGIERVTKTLLPVLFLLIIICDIRAVTLPGAGRAFDFLFHVDFGQITAPIILAALGLAFFKLSLGLGTMITYGSYFTESNNMVNNAFRVALSDTVVSLLAGIAIFPIVFSFGIEPGSGPGLLFMTIPLVFSQLPGGNILLGAFFLLTSIAATTAMISLAEVPVAYFSEEKGLSRAKSVIISSLIIMIIGVLATLSADQTAILGNISISGKRIFELFDYVSSNILLPIGGLLIALFIGHIIKKDEFVHELTNYGKLKTGAIVNLIYIIIRWVTPAVLIIVFFNSLGMIKIR